MNDLMVESIERIVHTMDGKIDGTGSAGVEAGARETVDVNDGGVPGGARGTVNVEGGGVPVVCVYEGGRVKIDFMVLVEQEVWLLQLTKHISLLLQLL